MCFKHLKRSVPIRFTGSTFYFRCLRGKQQHKRRGFDWAVPSTCGFTGWVWGAGFLDEWKSVTLADPNPECGIIFDTGKRKTFTNLGEDTARQMFYSH